MACVEGSFAARKVHSQRAALLAFLDGPPAGSRINRTVPVVNPPTVIFGPSKPELTRQTDEDWRTERTEHSTEAFIDIMRRCTRA